MLLAPRRRRRLALPRVDAPARLRRWAGPLLVYGASRVFVLVAMEIAAAASQSTAPFLSFAAPWDGVHYLDLARDGYPERLTYVDGHVGTSLHAFFPLYPLLVRAVGAVTPLGVEGSAVLVSLVAGAIATVLFWELAERLTSSRETADWSVLLFCFFPGAFVLSWAFSEALMLALLIGAALLLLRDRVWAAAGLCALATFTRPNAAPIVLSFAWLALLALRRDGPRPALRYVGAGTVAASGFFAYQGYLWARTGVPDAWWRVQREGFGEGVRPGHRLVEVLLEELPANVRTAAPLFTLLLVVLGVLLVVALLRAPSIPGWLRVYGLAVLVLALTSNTGPASPRLQFAAFPALLAAAVVLRGQLRPLALAGSAMFLIVLVIAYGNPTTAPFVMWAP